MTSGAMVRHAGLYIFDSSSCLSTVDKFDDVQCTHILYMFT